jgi:hypothetical protein
VAMGDHCFSFCGVAFEMEIHGICELQGQSKTWTRVRVQRTQLGILYMWKSFTETINADVSLTF